jgi:hypothetical protein
MSSDVEALKADLASGRERLLQSIAGVSEEQFKKRPPAAGTDGPNWCIAEVLAHLLQQERLRADRIALALDQDGVTIVPSADEVHYEAARAGRGAPVPQLIHGLLASRRELERLLDRTAALEAGLERATIHPRLGRQSIGWILRERSSPTKPSTSPGLKPSKPPSGESFSQLVPRPWRVRERGRRFELKSAPASPPASPAGLQNLQLPSSSLFPSLVPPPDDITTSPLP